MRGCAGQRRAHRARRQPARRPGRGVRAGRAGPGLRDLPGPGPPAPRAAGPAATDAAAGRPLVLLPTADLFGTHPLRARPAQCRLLPGRPPAAGPVGPVAGPARAGAAPGLRRRQPAIRRSGPTRAGQEAGPGSRPGSVPGLTLPGRRPGQTGGPAPAARPSRTAQHQPTAGQEHDMARFMDFHQDLKLPHRGPPGRRGASRRARPPAPGGAASAHGRPTSSRACRSAAPHRSGKAFGPADLPPRYRLGEPQPVFPQNSPGQRYDHRRP